MRRATTTLLLATSALGCDALIGGVCEEGFVYVEARGECVLEAALGGGDVGGDGGGGGVPITTSHGGGEPTGQGGSVSAPATGSGGAGGAPPGCEPLSDCSGTCVDLQSDPQNCGVCGLGCPTGICIDGACLGSPAGHLVITGLNYESATQGSATAKILGNALVMQQTEPLRVLMPQRSASTHGGMTPLVGLLQNELAGRGRSMQLTSVSIGQLAGQLAQGSTDVVVVASEGLAPVVAIENALPDLLMEASSFFGAGGVMIVLVGPSDQDRTSAFLTGFEPGLTLTTNSSGPFKVVSWTDALAIGAISPFMGQGPAVSFGGSDPQSISTVMATMGDEPILLHRAYAPD